MRCPACGSEDYRGFGFCVTCGKEFPKEMRSNYVRAPVEAVPSVDSLEQMRRSVTVALIVVGLFIVFFYVYLYLMGADPFLIFVVEAFPVFWMVAILLRWRRARQELGGKGNNKTG